MLYQLYKIACIFFISVFLFVFLTSCTNTNYPEPQTGQYKTKPKQIQYSDAIKQLANNLAVGVKRKLARESDCKGYCSIILVSETLEKNNIWNSFEKRLCQDLKVKLGTYSKFQMLHNNWEFSDEIGWDPFKNLYCPVELSIPQLIISYKVKIYSKEKEIRVSLSARRLNSREIINGFPIVENLDKQYYSQALDNILDSQKGDNPLGSEWKPFQNATQMAIFFSRILKCKFQNASKIWNEFHPESNIDFDKIYYSWAGITPCKQFTDEKIKKLNNIIGQQLFKSGVTKIDKIDILNKENNRYLFNNEIYLHNPKNDNLVQWQQGIIFGTIAPYYNNKMMVSLHIMLVPTNNSLNKGKVLPELGATCYYEL